MKRTQAGLMAMVILAALMAFAGMAYAGPFGAMKNWMAQNVIEAIIAGLAIIVGAFWGGAKLWAVFFKEAVDVPFAVKKARDPKSPGGRTITSDEMQNIGKEAAEATAAGMAAYNATKNKGK